ncbi:hypothetical protein MKZ87_21695 [Pseudomonas sp. MCal1]|uniref:hypothetical protein n=1 Tax=Pseudomonas sp. MCal1 TaxID=2919887 RepID=UPI0022531E97|nr:hypothetical protein [Pseudomonas sp. MCal1]MCX4220262.1 hypothetical protein [Pseudomonas sp. MCal1]
MCFLRFVSTTALLLGCGFCEPALAVIGLQPQVVEINTAPAVVEVTNNGDRPEYVSIGLSLLLNPGVEYADEHLETITLVREPALYAYPFRLSLSPGQTKAVQIKPLRTVDKETVYRLEVKPVMNLLGSRQSSPTGKIVVNLAFSGLVRQLPANKVSSLTVSCESYGARLTATGNVRYQVKKAQVNGVAIDPFNVYPGSPISLNGKSVLIPDQPQCQ